MSLSFVSSAVLSSSDGVSHNEEKPIESKEVQSIRKQNESKSLFEQLRANRDAEQERQDEIQKALRGTRTLDEEDCAHLDAVEKLRLEREALVRASVEEEVALFRAARADRSMAQSVEYDDDNEEDGVNNGSAGDDIIAIHDRQGSVKREGETDAVGKEDAKKRNAVGVKSFVPKIVVKRKRKIREIMSQNGSSVDGKVDADKKTATECRDENNKAVETKRNKQEGTIPESCEGGKSETNKEEIRREHDSDGESHSKGVSKESEEESGQEGGGLGGLLGGYGSSDDDSE